MVIVANGFYRPGDHAKPRLDLVIDEQMLNSVKPVNALPETMQVVELEDHDWCASPAGLYGHHYYKPTAV
jgi:hypothetical protein